MARSEAESGRGEAPIRDPSSLVSPKVIVQCHNVQLAFCSNGFVQCSNGDCSVSKLFKCSDVQYTDVQIILGQLTNCSIGTLFNWHIVQVFDVQFVLVEIIFCAIGLVQNALFR